MTPTGKVGFALKLNAKKIVYVILAVVVVAGILLAIDYFSDGMFGQTEDTSSSVEESNAADKKDPTVNMTMGEKLVYGLTTAGVGMAMVFLVLIILWGIISFIPKLLPEVKASPSAVSAKAAAAPASPAASSDEEELVAVCTAAIAAARGASDCAFKVISITEIK